ncbi:MAG TPA: hypothetical protein VF035_08105 [Longimicrobiales bacterium]
MRLLLGASLLAVTACASSNSSAVRAGRADLRAALRGGWMDAASAINGMTLVASRPRPEGFFDAKDPGNILLANSDMAFSGGTLFMGSFHGFQVWDVSNPSSPRNRTSVVCPGGQGDVSVHGSLLFMSVEMPNGRIDCGTQGSMSDPVSAERFLGVRIFDISNLDAPRQVAAVQTCRGSHTHTLVTDPRDPANVYIYVSGTSGVRPASELAGCSGGMPDQNPNTAQFRIEVIQVPVASPERAKIVNAPRIFADARTGNAAGLWSGGTHGPGTQTTEATDQCHDITVFPEIGLAGGACSGNGILLDISNPASPVRVDEVTDPNFAYWHSATFNNDGSKLIFTDEWGGGVQARCRAQDRKTWGADAIFDLRDRNLTQRGYYKLPVVQSEKENCVAHNGSIIPVPGRDIMVQAWYQGGISVFDFTDAANPVEIAFFDRGPVDPKNLALGGFWSAYWYNGHIYGSEIGRGLDILALSPTTHLSQNEIDAAALARVDHFNPQTQVRYTWPAHITVARAYLDQIMRARGIPADRSASIASEMERADRLTDAASRRAALARVADTVDSVATGAAGDVRAKLGSLAATLRGM